MIKKYDDEKIDEIKNALQERYIDEGYESLEDFEKDYYSFKPVSVRDLEVFNLEFHKRLNLSAKEYGYNVPEYIVNVFCDSYSLFEKTIFNRPSIKTTEIESEEDEKESENKRKVKSK